MKVEIIFAQDAAGGIGFEGRLPWPFFQPDMKRFQDVTSGDDKVIVMGRKTHGDILAAQKERGRKAKDIRKKGVLKGRTSVVLSTSEDSFDGATSAKSLRDVFNEYQYTDKTLVVIGGEKLFLEALPWTEVAHVTIFDKHFKCDRFLPTSLFNENNWVITPQQQIAFEGEDCHAYFVQFTRRTPVSLFGQWVRFYAQPY